MSLQLKSVQLINFQSWNDNSGAMEFDTSMLNVIKGRNETGKSVVFKVLYEMCFPGYHGSHLIRRGQEFGLAAFQLVDDTVIAFKMYRQGNRYFYILNPDDTHMEWSTVELPNEIIQKMGLIISKPNKIILNVLDKDVPLPFVKTDPAYNASVLQSNLEPQELTEFFDRAKDYIRRIQLAEGVHKQSLGYWEAKNQAIPYIDVDYLKLKKSILSTYTPLYKSCIDAYNSLYDLIGVFNQEPDVPVYDFGKSSNYLNAYKGIELLNFDLQGISKLNAPSLNTHLGTDIDLAKQLLHILSIVSDLYRGLSELTILVPPSIVVIPNLDYEFSLYMSLSSLVSKCAVVASMHAHRPKNISSSTESYLYLLDEVSKTKQLFTHRIVLEGKYLQSRQTLTRISENIKQIESDLKICPLCGRSYSVE